MYQSDPQPLVLDKKKANGFLRRKTPARMRRDLREECYGEGCSYEEVEEVVHGHALVITIPSNPTLKPPHHPKYQAYFNFTFVPCTPFFVITIIPSTTDSDLLKKMSTMYAQSPTSRSRMLFSCFQHVYSLGTKLCEIPM